jgi:hypothetical protein
VSQGYNSLFTWVPIKKEYNKRFSVQYQITMVLECAVVKTFF